MTDPEVPTTPVAGSATELASPEPPEAFLAQLGRLRALLENWRRWATDPSLPGGCVFVAAAAELDDRSGPVRAYVVSQQQLLLKAIAHASRLSIEAGHFRRDLDVEQFAFDVLGIYLAFHHSHRLLRDPKAEQRARRAYTRLLEDAQTRS